jgi:hypothetical protein
MTFLPPNITSASSIVQITVLRTYDICVLFPILGVIKDPINRNNGSCGFNKKTTGSQKFKVGFTDTSETFITVRFRRMVGWLKRIK